MERSRAVVGVDIAKRVFQLHWVETETGELMKLRLTRAKGRRKNNFLESAVVSQ